MLTLDRAKELLNTTTTEDHLLLHAKKCIRCHGWHGQILWRK